MNSILLMRLRRRLWRHARSAMDYDTASRRAMLFQLSRAAILKCFLFHFLSELQPFSRRSAIIVCDPLLHCTGNTGLRNKVG